MVQAATRAPNANPPRWLAPVIATGLAIYLAMFAYTVIVSFIRAPYSDFFDVLAIEFQAQDAHDPGLYLWSPHAGHHIVWLRILTSLDARLFGGNSIVFVVAALIALLTTTGMLVDQIARGVEPRGRALALAAVAPLALLTTLNAFDVSVPMNTPYVLALVFTVAAIIVVEQANGGLATALALLALVAAAAMGNSVGLATAPVVMIAVFRRPDRGRLPLLWLVLPILVMLFVIGAGRMAVPEALSVETPVARGLRMFRYFVSFCGLPWSASSERTSLPGGLQAVTRLAGPTLGLLLAGAGLVLSARPATTTSAKDRLDRICCSLILFSLAAAAMAALGRVDVSAGIQIPVRYAVLMAPLQIGVVVLLVIRGRASLLLRDRSLAAAVAAVFVLGVAHQYLGARVIMRYCAHITQVMADYNAGKRTPEMSEYVYPGLAHADQISAEMRRRGLYQ